MPKNLFNLDKLKLNALPDSLDFRDKMYIPTLVEVPSTIPLSKYQEYKIPILDQGICLPEYAPHIDQVDVISDGVVLKNKFF